MSENQAAADSYKYHQEQEEKCMTRDPLLREREETYGDYSIQGSFANLLKTQIRKEIAVYHQKKIYGAQLESLDMICTKISRLVHGDALFIDTWNDIAGYAKLAAEACQPK